VVFLDAGHDEASVAADILAWMPAVRPGGLLAGDDYNNNWPGVNAAVDRLLPAAKAPGTTWVCAVHGPCAWWTESRGVAPDTVKEKRAAAKAWFRRKGAACA